jgi:hypothetical protein
MACLRVCFGNGCICTFSNTGLIEKDILISIKRYSVNNKHHVNVIVAAKVVHKVKSKPYVPP